MLPGGDTHYETLRDLSLHLARAPRGQAGPLVESAAARLGLSVKTVYRRLKELGLATKPRKQRADAGSTVVPEAVARRAAGLVFLATRANDKRLTTIKAATHQVIANGMGATDPETGEIRPVSPGTMARAMRKYACHPDQLAAGHPHLTMRSLHPNHVWQVDSSVCTLFYAPGKGLRIQGIDEREVYKNKPDAVARVARDLCLRWAVTDHTTGAFKFLYHAGTEDSWSFIEFFIWATQCRDNKPMHGVPKILVMDPGSAARAATARNLLERLGIKVIVHRAKNPRAKGQVEGCHNLIETGFEGRLALWNPPDIQALNERAQQWADAWQSTAIHTRHRMTRYAAWMRIRESELVIAPAPELCRELVTTKPQTRQVAGDLTISYACPRHESATYRVAGIPGAAPGERLTVVVNPYRAPAIDVLVTNEDGSVTAHTVEPVAKDGWQFLEHGNVWGETPKALPKTAAERQLDAIRLEAYGVPTQAEADAARKARQDAYAGVIDPFADVKAATVPTFIPRRGQEHPVTAAAPSRELPDVPVLQALRELVAEGWPKEGLYERLKAEFPGGAVPAAELADRKARGPRAGLRAVG